MFRQGENGQGLQQSRTVLYKCQHRKENDYK